jgi:hypothetical protein
VDLAQVAPAGIAAVLGFVILYLLNANRLDRIEHRKERIEWDGRLKGLESDYDIKITKLGERMEKLEDKLRSETRRADRAETRLALLTGGSPPP